MRVRRKLEQGRLVNLRQVRRVSATQASFSYTIPALLEGQPAGQLQQALISRAGEAEACAHSKRRNRRIRYRRRVKRSEDRTRVGCDRKVWMIQYIDSVGSEHKTNSIVFAEWNYFLQVCIERHQPRRAAIPQGARSVPKCGMPQTARNSEVARIEIRVVGKILAPVARNASRARNYIRP